MLERVQPRADALMDIIQKVGGTESLDVAKLEHLLAVKERWDAEEARKEYVAAMTRFRATAPALYKTDLVTHRGGTYHYLNLGQVAPVVAAALAQHDLSYGWSTDQLVDGRIRVTCSLTHVAGHCEQVSLMGMPDDTGAKNSIQQVGSTVTYLERYTLMAITGLAAQDMDTDGRPQAPAQATAPAEGQEPAKAQGVAKGRCEWHDTPFTKLSSRSGAVFHHVGDNFCLGHVVVDQQGGIVELKDPPEGAAPLDPEPVPDTKSSGSEESTVESRLSAIEAGEADEMKDPLVSMNGHCPDCPGNPPWLRRDDQWRTRYHWIPGGEHVNQEDQAARDEDLPF